MKCECCENDLSVRWTDTHGVGACSSCGLPYTILHYEGEGSSRQRVEKAPEAALHPDGVAIAKEYWSEKKMRVFPGVYDMGMDRSGRTYSGATRDEISTFDKWYAARESANSATV